jgi:UDP-N-acetylglucosamine--N-acetylmuramyl-(pentapeptide) pyrophosphoryl-undecaprenol N-acetylglucosamine transferase
MRVMITGGGTGGHTSPAAAIIEELRKRDPQLLLQWAGRGGSIEARVSRSLGIPFRPVPAEGWPRRNKLRRPWVLLKMAAGILRAFLLLRRFHPDIVIGVGGYVSLPVVWAAQRRGIPTVLHEQNKRLGMANRLLAARAAKLFLSFEDTGGGIPEDRAVVTGNPVRAGFLNPPAKEAAREKLGLDPRIPAVFACGGSQGARTINHAITEMLPRFEKEDMQVIWMTGKSDAEAARAAAEKAACTTQVYPFIDDMVTACAAADLMISRAGASSAAEIAVLAKPAILIPYPFATDNHQEQNARAAAAAGAAVVLLDSDCTGDRLYALVRELLSDAGRLEAMRDASAGMAKPVAAEVIAEEIMALLFGAARNDAAGGA